MIAIAIGTVSLSYAGGYDRKDFNYRSYKPNTSIGFYTNKTCNFINIDHIVSLKDAYESGAASWGANKKKAFAKTGLIMCRHAAVWTVLKALKALVISCAEAVMAEA